MLDKIRYHVGHRGLFLLLLGLAFIFYGLGIHFQPHAYDIYPGVYFPWAWWSWIWIGTGIAAVIGAFRKRDRVSFAIAAVASSFWSFRWFHASFLLPHAGLWTTGFTWVLIAGIILIVSAWPEVHIKWINLEHESDNETENDT